MCTVLELFDKQKTKKPDGFNQYQNKDFDLLEMEYYGKQIDISNGFVVLFFSLSLSPLCAQSYTHDVLTQHQNATNQSEHSRSREEIHVLRFSVSDNLWIRKWIEISYAYSIGWLNVNFGNILILFVVIYVVHSWKMSVTGFFLSFELLLFKLSFQYWINKLLVLSKISNVISKSKTILRIKRNGFAAEIPIYY